MFHHRGFWIEENCFLCLVFVWWVLVCSLFVCLFVCLVGWLVGWLVDLFVCLFVCLFVLCFWFLVVLVFLLNPFAIVGVSISCTVVY